MFDEETVRQMARDHMRAGEAYHSCANVLHLVNRLSEQLPQAQRILASYRAFIQTLVSSYASPETLLRSARVAERQLLLLPEHLHALEHAQDADAAWQALLFKQQQEEEECR